MTPRKETKHIPIAPQTLEDERAVEEVEKIAAQDVAPPSGKEEKEDGK